MTSARSICRRILAASLMLHLPGDSWSQDPEAYGRAGIFVFEPVAGDGNSTRIKASSYGAGIPPGPGKYLRVFADANVPAVVLIAVFEKNKNTLRKNLKPALLESAEPFSEVSFPSGKKPGLAYEAGLKPFEIIVTVFNASDARVEELKKLVSAIHEAKTDEVFELQGAELKKRIDGWVRKENRSDVAVPYAAPSVAAVRRAAAGTAILWREHVYKKPVTDSSPSIFLFSVPAKSEAE